MNKTVIAILSILLLSACATNSIKPETVLSESEEELTISIDSDVNIYTMSMHHFIDNDNVEYITIENNNYKPHCGAIIFYRLDSCKLYQIVEIANTGPNAVQGLFGHGVISSDRILVSSLARNTFSLINAKGEILRKYDYTKDAKGNYCGVSYFPSIYYTPMIINNGILYGPQEPVYIDGKVDFRNSPLSITIDTATGEVNQTKWHFPKLHDANNKIGYNEQFSCIFDGNRFVYSFCALDSIYIATENGEMKSHVAKSKYMGEVYNSGFSPNAISENEFAITNTKARYGNIVYDKWNNVYYRFCHYAENKKEIPREYLLCHGAFSIIILDNDLNVIGETKFQAGKYAPMLFFVNKKGLWISENNYERTDMTDDNLVFKCLKLIK